jgi:arabinooligosaccharide transport system substrate-binding protein
MINNTPNELSRREFLRLLAITGGATALSACTPALVNTSEPTKPSTSLAGPVTLTMWTHDKYYVDFFNARAQEWKANYPEIQFTFDFQQVGDVFVKVLANLAAGEVAPDLLGFEQSWFPNFMKDDIIEQKFVDLTPKIGDERKKFVEGTWGKYIHKGKIYGVESALCASVLYYQPEVLEKHNFQIPATWEELMETGPALGAKGVAFGLADAESDFVFTVLFQQRGGQYFHEDGTFALTDDANRQAFRDVCALYRDGIDKKYLFAVNGADFWGPTTFTAFSEGKVASIAMPDWYSGTLKGNAADMTGKWRVAPMPMWKNSKLRTGTWGGTGFGISSESKYVDLAWDLLHYSYMTQENQVKRFLEINYYPNMYDAINDPRVKQLNDPYYNGDSLGQSLAQVAADTPVWYQSPVRRDMIEALGVVLPLFAKGEMDADQMIDEIAKKVDEAFKALG